MEFYISLIILTFCAIYILKSNPKEDKKTIIMRDYDGDVDQYEMDYKSINDEFIPEKYTGFIFFKTGLLGTVSIFHFIIYILLFDPISDKLIHNYWTTPFMAMLYVIIVLAIITSIIRFLIKYILKSNSIFGINSKIFVKNITFKKIIKYSLWLVLISIFICIIVLNFAMTMNYGLRDKMVYKYERKIISEKILHRKYGSDGKRYLVDKFYDNITSVADWSRNNNFRTGNSIVISLENGLLKCPVNIKVE